MSIRQVSVFLENEKGRLADVTRLLTTEKVNIRALALADTADFGVLRLIVDNTDECLSVLKAHNFVAQQIDVVAVEVEDRPGGLHRILEVFDAGDVNVEYMYTFVEKAVDKAVLVFRIEDQEHALDVLKENGIATLSDASLQDL